MNIGQLVRLIQKENTIENAIETFLDEAKIQNLNELWIRSVYIHKKTIPILDTLFDVHGKGVIILDELGVSPETQTIMWNKWPTLPEDVQASWIESFSEVDEEDIQDVITFISILIVFLTT